MFFSVDAQKGISDTLTDKEFLPDITVVGATRGDIHQLPEIVGTHIFAGKKNALIVLDKVAANVVNNNMRQVMAKVPGIHVWESDGSGIQIGVATRGLSPNRSWDFNVRQNGYDIAADPFGYPEAYYNPPLQAVQRLQIVKGAGALQFGPALGGVLNYVLKNGSNINQKFQYEGQQTIGSFGLVNTFNAVGGEGKKDHYYAFFDHRNADVWRENSRYKTNTGFATYTYRFSDALKVTGEFLYYTMLSQQPGGLTDSMFAKNAKQSSRSRNWFNNDWTVGAVTVDFQPNTNHIFNLKIFGMGGDRNSVGFTQAITINDTINASTKQYNNRMVDIDKYRNAGAELRYLHHYKILSKASTLTASIRYFNGNTSRFRNGKGTTGTEFDLNIADAVFPGDLFFRANNIAVALENILHVNKKLIIIPGVRWETISTQVTGRLNFNSNGTENKIDATKSRSFLLMGLAAEYHIGNTELYANVTQSFRPIQFADLAVSATTDVIDPDLKDGKGLSIDLGYRGKVNEFLFFDVNAFYLNYENRIASITQLRADGTSYNFRTNVGNSFSRGVEALADINFTKFFKASNKFGEVSFFASYAYTDAQYGSFKVVTKPANSSILVESNLKNNRVENAPHHILRSGLTYGFKGFSITTQLSYVSDVFADANNTVVANATATNGIIPSYTIIDVAASYKIQSYTFKAGLNNVGNNKYFTRRAGGYPGPGLMPSDARSFYVTVGIRL
jgi:Fe(3+) dicitrate transport protein